MKLQEVLDKFFNSMFLITVDDWCCELPFSEYESEKKEPYWDEFKNKKVKAMSIIKTNSMPELVIRLE